MHKDLGFMNSIPIKNGGNPRNYTLMINTSKMSTEETVQLLASFYDAKKGILTFKNAFENQYEKDNKY